MRSMRGLEAAFAGCGPDWGLAAICVGVLPSSFGNSSASASREAPSVPPLLGCATVPHALKSNCNVSVAVYCRRCSPSSFYCASHWELLRVPVQLLRVLVAAFETVQSQG